MKENLKQSKYPSKNLETETYTFITKNYYDSKSSLVGELSYLSESE